MMRLTRKRAIALGVILAVAATTTVVLWRRAASAPESPEAVEAQPVTVTTAPAVFAPVETTVFAQGTLTPAQGASAKIASPVTGRILQVSVREGQAISAGQVIAVIENRALLAQVSGAGAGVATAVAQAQSADLQATATAAEKASAVKVARLALDAARVDRDHAVKQARIALATAETELKKVKAGARPQEIAQAQQSVAQAKATRDRAATEAARVKDLFDHGVNSQRQLDDAQTALAVADSALESAKQQLDLLHAGARPEEIEAAKLAVDNAQQSLEQVQSSGAAHIAEAQATLQQAQESSHLDVATKRQDARAMRLATSQRVADLQASQATAAQSILRAPFGGTVTHRLLNPGDMADPTMPIVEMGDAQTLNLVANLPAEDGVRTQPGMPARLTSPDLPAEPISGSVVSVGQVDPATNLMAVRIAVANTKGTLKLGMFLQAAIILSSNSHALVVPKTAVITREGKSVVFTVDQSGKARLHEVVTGQTAGDRLEIKSGLQPGDQVITLGQYELVDGAAVKATAAKAGAPS